MIVQELIVLDSRDQPAASCAVCGNEVAAGDGVTARYAGQLLRFRCSGCVARFEADPDRYLAGQTGGCCGGGHDDSPASEWLF